MQDAVELTLMNAVEIFDILKANLVGLGQFFVSVRPQAGLLFTRTVVPCKDGYMTLAASWPSMEPPWCSSRTTGISAR